MALSSTGLTPRSNRVVYNMVVAGGDIEQNNTCFASPSNAKIKTTRRWNIMETVSYDVPDETIVAAKCETKFIDEPRTLESWTGSAIPVHFAIRKKRL
jgi:hypothetical protein